MKSKRVEIFNYIKDCTKKNGDFPSFQDIADSVGVSKSTAHYHVSVLKRKKVLVKDPVRGYIINPEYEKNNLTAD